jgi:LuxR family transcriptional regulator, regulator of acetate metabolism
VRQTLHMVSSCVSWLARGACLAEPLHNLSSPVPRFRAVHGPAATDVSRRLRSVQRALLRLGSEQSLGRLVNLAPRFACQALELDRAMLLHISGNNIVSGTAWWGGDQVAASDFARFLRAAHPQLTSCPPEFESVQRQLPILVTNAQRRDDVYRPLVHAARSEAYVVAPMVRGDRVIGLLHADRFPVVDRHLDVLDRDLLWTFATGLADLIDRAASRGLRGGPDAMFAEPACERADEPAVASISATSGPLALLTAREHEVLGLLAEGAANASIAARLVISEATVKSHVRHILRKLRAANRTEAVIRYQTLVAGEALAATSS